MVIQNDAFASATGTDVTDLERRLQFRMQRLQVLNWGTFSGLHDIGIAEDGFLFVGRSGSGKSTLLDAFAALLVPPLWLSFNAAAREGERGRHDRNLSSYIRGAWADQKDAGSGEVATRHLRTGTTWSALALTLANGEGRTVTLVQLFWLRGTASGNTDVRRHFMIADRPFDIAGELDGFDLDIRALKRRLADVDHFDTFRPYCERFRRLLGIESEMALKLLHRTQSAKNLGDLNTFLREFMLDRPSTFEAADRLVAEFAELDAAHQAVVTARRQVDTLLPARDASVRLAEVGGEIAEREHLLEGIDVYRDRLRTGLLEQETAVLRVRDEGLEGEEHQCRDRLLALENELNELESEYRETGGGQIERLENDKAAAEQQRGERLKRRGQAEAACKTLGWMLPDDARLFAERVGEARSVVDNWQAELDAAEAHRDGLRDEKKKVEEAFTAVRREIEAMERQPSNIPAYMLDLRRQIADTLGLSEAADLPFAGELIQVKDDAQDWRGAAERVLHGFALSLLVDKRRYAAVSQYVNDNHLGQRLVYYRVDDAPARLERPAPHSLIHKLELRDSTYRSWLYAELSRRFDYACVDTMEDFRRAKRALTREGQIRHGPDRHEKDDRRRIDDPRSRVLGFDNREKLALYKQQARELGQQLSDIDRQLTDLKEARNTQQHRFSACLTLVNLNWSDIDVAPLLERIGELEQKIRSLCTGNRALEQLNEQLQAQRNAVGKTKQQLDDILLDRRRLAADLAGHRKEIEDLAQKLEATVHLLPDQYQALGERFNARGTITLKNLDDRRMYVERAINGELTGLRGEQSTLEKTIEQTFDHFKREWPQEGADMDATVHAVPEFMALLQRLEHDGLPRHEQRFFDMLKEQSSENLAALNAHLAQARKQIRERMELVNEGLAEAHFNPGTHLQIEVSDRHLPDVREFRERVQQILGHAWQMDREEAEQRFLVLRGLVQRLGGQDPDQRRWREQVLDVRLHVEFIGRELDEEGQEVEIYRSGAGKSGGQREKLATTCLAAALRYQLGGADGGLPAYAPVILDEAFAKADNEFTELVMKIFQRFGFQMIVATPLKSVMTLEPFIGGACFVDIADRKRSSTLPIDYDATRHRLDLPAVRHGESVPA